MPWRARAHALPRCGLSLPERRSSARGGSFPPLCLAPRRIGGLDIRWQRGAPAPTSSPTSSSSAATTSAPTDVAAALWLTSHLQSHWAISPRTSTPLLLYSRSQNTKTSFRDGGVGMGEGALHPQGPDPEARRPRPANREPANNSAVENWTVRNRQE